MMDKPKLPCLARIKGYEDIKAIAIRVVEENRPSIRGKNTTVTRVYLVIHRDWLRPVMRERRAADGLDDELVYTAQYLQDVEFTDEAWDSSAADVFAAARRAGAI